jgi:hypothetical protein
MESNEKNLVVISQIELVAMAYDLVYYSSKFQN